MQARRSRCRILATYSCRDFTRPRSWLLSTDGVEDHNEDRSIN
ncbi:MAG: hypothetical protein ACRDSZ_20575 [Pseudonocardiaceae bacterium]